MDAIKLLLSGRKNVIALLILGILVVGIVVGVRLVQEQTQLKSRAAASPGLEIKFQSRPDKPGTVTGDSCTDPAATDPTQACVATDRNIQLEITNPFISGP